MRLLVTAAAAAAPMMSREHSMGVGNSGLHKDLEPEVGNSGLQKDLEPEVAPASGEETAQATEKEGAPATEMCANAVKAAQALREILASLPRSENSVAEDIQHGNVEDVGQSDNLKRLIASISNMKRKRSNTEYLDGQSASSPTPVSPTRKRRKRPNSKKSLVWQHFNTGPNAKDNIAICNYCDQVYACDRSTHGTSTLWYHLRFICPKEPLKGQDLPKKKQELLSKGFVENQDHIDLTEFEA